MEASDEGGGGWQTDQEPDSAESADICVQKRDYSWHFSRSK